LIVAIVAARDTFAQPVSPLRAFREISLAALHSSL